MRDVLDDDDIGRPHNGTCSFGDEECSTRLIEDA
jgi:hypothetical protein